MKPAMPLVHFEQEDALGVLTVFQFMPALLLSLVAGVVADRVGKQRLIMITSALEALQRASTNGVGRLAVLDGTRLIGYLSLKDLGHVLALRSLPAAASARAAVPGQNRQS